MKKLHILIAAVALAVAAGGVGYAAVPSADGTISACKDKDGRLKVIDAEDGQTCKAGQELLTWNQGGISGLTTEVASSVFSSENKKVAYVQCPAGMQAISGGGFSAYPYGNGEQVMPGVAIVWTRSEGNGWSVVAEEMIPTSDSWTLVATATCAYVS
jgi:hypothetical protein